MAHVAPAELRSVNPATLESVGSVPVSAPEEVAEAVSDARLAAGRWAESSFEERRALLGRVAAAVLESADEIAATVTAETGKPLPESPTPPSCSSNGEGLWPRLEAAWRHRRGLLALGRRYLSGR